MGVDSEEVSRDLQERFSAAPALMVAVAARGIEAVDAGDRSAAIASFEALLSLLHSAGVAGELVRGIRSVEEFLADLGSDLAS